ncbi:hypothetical protein CALVIDRAFT_543134 [Calocera viscosa TUFC12733]|uniref:Non-structural maintenance of chromosomes element 1 homolog n=1 Tax=Calocera viscosa (strain TUFC12733) TaxID=1330018 RepID=A0A167FXC7_CALVF|nr:hypothetical protein CALVIDRAFT_543134 [Calocera viscosa TUFC12733]
MIAIVNTKGDAIAQVATEFSPNEIAYFRLIVECIMLAPSESFSLSSIAAIKESANLPSKMTKTEAESTLNAFVSKGWLVKSKRGRYSLSTRSLLELQTYLKTTFEDEVLDCTICMEMVTKGIACSTARCKTRMHMHCYDDYKLKKRRVCPNCQSPWEELRLIPVGEDAVKDGPDSRRRSRRVEREQSMEEEEEEEDEEEMMQPPQEAEEDELMESETPPPAQRNSRQRRATQMSMASQLYDDEAEED